MSTKVDIPKLDWFERYKRLLDFGWGILAAEEDFIYNKWGREALDEFLQKTRPEWSGAIAKRLISKMDIKPDVEGAVKLLGMYGQEIWGFGDPQYFDARLETPTKGTFANLVCRGWEKTPEHCRKMNCDIACSLEFGGVVAALSPDLKVTLTKALPRGDDRCEYTVEL